MTNLFASTIKVVKVASAREVISFNFTKASIFELLKKIKSAKN